MIKKLKESNDIENLEEVNELEEFVDDFIKRGYKVNGHLTNKEMILAMLEMYGAVRFIKKKRILFYTYNKCISITKN